MAVLTMPRVADSTTLYVVASVEVAANDVIEPDDVVLVVETDKVEVDVPAGVSGIVTAVLVAAEDEVSVGDPILSYEER